MTRHLKKRPSRSLALYIRLRSPLQENPKKLPTRFDSLKWSGGLAVPGGTIAKHGHLIITAGLLIPERQKDYKEFLHPKFI